MDELAARHKISAWKTYTQYGPGGKGFFMDDEPGIAMIEKARKLGIRNIAIHKGLALRAEVLRALDLRGHRPRREALSRRELPHLPLGLRRREEGRPLRPEAHRRRRRAGARASWRTASSRTRTCTPSSGSTWRFAMRDPDTAAHALGKLLQVLRRGQRAVGHGLDLVRLAAGPDPGVPHVPDLARAAREARLPRDHAGAAREGVRAERAQDLSGAQGRAATSTCAATRWRWRARSTEPSAPIPPSSPTDRRRGASSSTSRPGADSHFAGGATSASPWPLRCRPAATKPFAFTSSTNWRR